MTNDELSRYSRHILLPEIGAAGQEKLKAARVLVVGMGGLGAPISLYLAAAGVGEIGIVDFDSVEESNLQRQAIHSTKTIGAAKVDSAKERLQAINPLITITAYRERLTAANALLIIKNYDIVADATDNYAARYLLNDSCVFLNKPLVYGSIFRFDAQIAVFKPRESGCYRCLFPAPPPPYLAPSCAEGGVLGALPGAVGALQAGEVIKLIVGAEGVLAGRLTLLDMWRGKFREVKFSRDLECPVCGENPTITALIDYENFCGLKGGGINLVKPADLESRVANGAALVDVREKVEVEIAALDGAINIPISEFASRLAEIPLGREVIFACRSGIRSERAILTLQDAGILGDFWSLEGGLDARK
ncbi:MAG: molybdopterin-synthase adenylyltransferase MoeB [Helicobacteraceae bacterium]|jgi:adenylyltransferase/sulfurtransferase|nr:molybdopterin-synthase adenylyltransferase MoeB [Helicobacteraceae bacterium]